MAALGLRCCVRASHCSGFSLRSTGSRHAGFSSCGSRASVVVAHGLKSAGSVVVAHGLSCSAHVGSSRTRARTHVPCIGRRILNHCATREVPRHYLWVYWQVFRTVCFWGLLIFNSHIEILNHKNNDDEKKKVPELSGFTMVMTEKYSQQFLPKWKGHQWGRKTFEGYLQWNLELPSPILATASYSKLPCESTSHIKE